MAERQNLLSSFALRGGPMNMKLFAAGDLDRTPSHCVPRLCNLTITRLHMPATPTTGDTASVSLAVKMHASGRTLRSNELPLPQGGGPLDQELQLCYSLQYPHFVKRDGNSLQVMLQRRKRYKNRTILGYKTLAVGRVSMAQVLQCPADRELSLFSEAGKEKAGHPGGLVARVTLEGLSSQPVDTDEADLRLAKSFLADNAGRGEELLDSEDSYSSADDGSDSEPMLDARPAPSARQRNLKQRFISLLRKFKVPEGLQAYETDPELDPRAGPEDDIEYLMDQLGELSDSGPEDPELDAISVTSAPRPGLRPYFSSSRSLLLADQARGGTHLEEPRSSRGGEGATAPPPSPPTPRGALLSPLDSLPSSAPTPDAPPAEVSPPPQPPPDKTKLGHRSSKSIGGGGGLFGGGGGGKERGERRGASATSTPAKGEAGHADAQTPRKGLQEQLAAALPLEEGRPLPEAVVLLDGDGAPGLAGALAASGLAVLSMASAADVRASLQHLVCRLQRGSHGPHKGWALRLVLVGSDAFVNTVLRPYVELFSRQPPDFASTLRFLLVPRGGVSSLAKYLGSVDPRYGAAFVSEWWRGWEGGEGGGAEAAARVTRYISHADHTIHLPIAEAVLTYTENTSEDTSSQTFIPFVTDVRLGSGDVTSSSADVEETSGLPVATSGNANAAAANQGPSPFSPPGLPLPSPCSTPAVGGSSPPSLEQWTASPPHTPPGSPSLNTHHLPMRAMDEALELQVDYWQGGRGEARGGRGDGAGGRQSLKTLFRTLQVARLAPLGLVPPPDPLPPPCLTFSYATKENKKRLMRLGKKRGEEKGGESRRDVLDGVTRVLASTRTQPVTVTIDSVSWRNVKFFQLSSQWQTQIKTFPVALFNLQTSSS